MSDNKTSFIGLETALGELSDAVAETIGRLRNMSDRLKATRLGSENALRGTTTRDFPLLEVNEEGTEQ